MAGEDYKNLNWTKTNYPFYYLYYGDKEPEPFIIVQKILKNF
jgi:hypothetical protein